MWELVSSAVPATRVWLAARRGDGGRGRGGRRGAVAARGAQRGRSAAGRVARLSSLAAVDDDEIVVASRAECSGSAGACWVRRGGRGGDVLLTMHLRRLGGHYVTAVWLTAPTQETQNEFAGVAAPLFALYNEGGRQFTHSLVVPGEPRAYSRRITRSNWLVVSGGREGDTLLAAAVDSPHAVPPLLARGTLRDRVVARRRAPPAQEEEELELSEEAVRACCAPTRCLQLDGRVLALQPHPDGRCVWTLVRGAAGAGGALLCVSAPALEPLRRLPAPASLPCAVQIAVSLEYLAAPACDGSGRVCVWSAVTGAPCEPPGGATGVPGELLAVLLPPACRHPAPTPPAMLLLTENSLELWRSRAPDLQEEPEDTLDQDPEGVHPGEGEGCRS